MTNQVSESKFAAWRGAVALAYIDHTLSEAEKQKLHQYFSKQPFSDVQKSQLDKDIDQGVDLDTVFPKITDKRDRATLINISRVLAYADGVFCEKEQEAFEHMMSRHMPTVDIDAARKEADFITKEINDKYKMGPVEAVLDYVAEFFMD